MRHAVSADDITRCPSLFTCGTSAGSQEYAPIAANRASAASRYHAEDETKNGGDGKCRSNLFDAEDWPQ